MAEAKTEEGGKTMATVITKAAADLGLPEEVLKNVLRLISSIRKDAQPAPRSEVLKYDPSNRELLLDSLITEYDRKL